MKFKISSNAFNEGASIPKKHGGGWKRTGWSKRVLNSRIGRFIRITAAQSFTRRTRHSRPSKRMTSRMLPTKGGKAQV